MLPIGNTMTRKPKPQAYPVQYATRYPPGILERIDAVSPNRNEFIRQAVIKELGRKEMKGDKTMKIKLWVEDEDTGEVLEDLGTCLTDSPGRAVQMYDAEEAWIEKGHNADIHWEDITDRK